MKYFLLILFSLSLQCFAQEQFPVYFNSDKYEPSAGETQKLNAWLAANKEVKIVAIDGYTDEDGTLGYNDTLALKRVNTIFAYLKDKVKIREDFRSRNYGERRQLFKNKAENRKVVIFYILAKDLPRENEILGIKEEAEVPKPKPPVSFPEKIVLHNPDGTDSEFTLSREFMQKVNEAKAGEKLLLQNLNFQINTFAITPESRGKLYELLLVMQKSPKLKIDIQGYLCCMPVDRLDLSTQRAKAVKNFLVSNGIDKSRITYKGFGSTKAIYPLPEKTEDERAANRRVEIEITENP